MEEVEPINKTRPKRRKRQTANKKQRMPLVFTGMGLLFILAGLVYALDVFENSNALKNILLSLFQPQTTTEAETEAASGSLDVFLLYYLPPLIGLGLLGYFRSWKSQHLTMISTGLSIVIFFLQIILVQRLFAYGEWYFTTLWVALVFLSIIVAIQLWNAFRLKSKWVLIISSVIFYFSVLLFSVFYLVNFEYFFSVIVLFSIAFFVISEKLKSPSLNLLNLAFALGFMGLFWLRKFVVNSKPDFLVVFIVFATAFYILFYTITLLASRKQHDSLPKWSQLAMLWGNFLFFAITMGFVMLRYYGAGQLWMLSAGMLLLHLAGMSAMKRFESFAWKWPHYFLLIVLASLMLPLLGQQSMLLLFASGMSLGLLYYTLQYKEKFSYWAFVGSFFVMLGMLAYYWLSSYLPAIVLPKEVPGNELMWHGVLSTTAVAIALAALYYMLKDEDVPSAGFSMDGSLLKRMVRVFLWLAAFAAAGWIGSFIVIAMEGSTFYVPMVWFFTGASIFIVSITLLTGKKSFLKLPVLYSGFAFMLLYLPLVQWRMISINTIRIESGTYLALGMVLHVLDLLLLFVLSVMVIRRVVTQAAKKPAHKAVVQFISIVFISLVLCFEYENLYVLLTASKAGVAAGYIASDALLSGNRYLPFSVVSGMFMVGVLIKSLLDNDNSMRNIAFVLLGILLLKVFFYDFDILSTGMRAVVFIATGVMLLGIAMAYPRIQKEGKQRYERKHKKKRVEA